MKYTDVLIAMAAAGAILALGIQVGRDIERWDGVRAEETPPAKVLDKYAAWNGIYGRPRAPREDLRLAGSRISNVE
jgi:hypothetical protein